MKIKKSVVLFLMISISVHCLTAQIKKVVFEGSFSEQKWAVKTLNPDLPADWSSFEFLTLELRSSTAQRFELKLYDAKGMRKLVIHPFEGAWIRASLPLKYVRKRNTQGMDMAAIGKIPGPGYCVGFTNLVGSIDHVDSLGVAMVNPFGSPTLEIRDVKLTMTAEDAILEPKPLVDEFGQWIKAEWPGKIKSTDELKSDWRQEEKSLKSDNFNYCKYGGYLGTRVKATGFFRVEKIDEKWWFIDPDGHLFFSIGSDCIGAFSDTKIDGREAIFSAIPPDYTDNMRRDEGTNKSFYTWNLYRRFGPEWYKKWMDLTFLRMESWGMNTIGNWSDPKLGKTNQKAYVVTLRGWGIETGIMGMPDVYDADFADKIDKAAAEQCAPLKDDPYVLGYFIGNEPPWPERELELVEVILAGKQIPMQTALMKYFSAGDTPDRRKAFVYDTYAVFIRTINEAIKKYDPNHLNLGLRFASSTSPEIIQASKGFDVFSINSYGYSVDLNRVQKINQLTGLPLIIGEFHFGALGRGLAPGLKQTKSQEERGVAYRYYVENAASHPAIIGTHWFQWIDQPVTGRMDGENYNIGMVDVTDQPYMELIDAVKETHKRLLDVHSGKEMPVSKKALIQ